MLKKIPASLIVFLVTIPLVFILESQILLPHLKYGFGDVDWGYLYVFKQVTARYHNPILQLINIWKQVGVYSYQSYYTGILEHFFPMDNFNFVGIHQATDFLKFLSAITVFPLALVLTRSKVIASITTILYSVSYSSFGPIYTVAVSGNYPAIAVLNIFAAYYIYIVRNNKNQIFWLLGGTILFILTLFLSTERMYPLIPIIILGEIMLVWSQKFSKSSLKLSSRRLFILFCPLIFFLGLKTLAGNSAFGDAAGFFPNTIDIMHKMSEGNWSVALTPFIAFGSLFLPQEYWDLIGSSASAMSSFSSFFKFFLHSFLLFFLFSLIFAFIASKKPRRFMILSVLFSSILGVLEYILATHHLHIDPTIRLNFDSIFLRPALVGMFVLAIALSCLFEWILDDQRNLRSLYLSLGPLMAFIFIFLTWIPSAWNLIFEGVHRYLAIPALGSSFFLATSIDLLYEKVRRIKKLRTTALVIFLLIIPLIQLNFFVVGRYFDRELNDSGMDGEGQKKMKMQLLSSIGDFNLSQPMLFYFDEEDQTNGYFQETAVIAGFHTWMRFRGKSEPRLSGYDPQYIRNGDLGSQTNVYCTGPSVDCLGTLRKLIVTKNGQKGILFKNIFYPLSRFYAFKLSDRQMIDIKKEILQ